jgi:hypothetical protein
LPPPLGLQLLQRADRSVTTPRGHHPEFEIKYKCCAMQSDNPTFIFFICIAVCIHDPDFLGNPSRTDARPAPHDAQFTINMND